MAGGLGSIILAYILWSYTENLFLAAIIACLAWPLLNPIVIELLKLIIAILMVPVMLIRAFFALFEPDMPISVLRIDNGSPNAAKEQGMRILLVSKGETCFFSDKSQKDAFASSATLAVRELYESNEVFRHKFDYVHANDQPESIYATWYKTVTEKCMSKWRKILKAESFAFIEGEGHSFATKVKQVEDNGIKRNIFVQIFFDKNLPAPEKKAEPAEKKKETVTISTDYEMKFDEPATQIQEGLKC